MGQQPGRPDLKRGPAGGCHIDRRYTGHQGVQRYDRAGQAVPAQNPGGAAEYGGKLALDGEFDWGEPIGREVW